MPAVSLVEELAQKRFKYETLFENQAAILRRDPVEYQKAYDCVSKSPGVAQDGQRWMPQADQKVAYMNYLEDICNKTPQSSEERMEICFAAQALLACLIRFDIGQQPYNIQLQIIKRSTELYRSLKPVNRPRPLVPDPSLPALRKQSPMRSHKVTDKELQNFLQNPLELLDKQFVLQDGGQEEEVLFKVIKVGKSKGKGNFYDVQYDDCPYAIEADQEEMMRMLQESLLIDA